MNAVDKEYGEIDYVILQQIRVNSSVCYHVGSDRRGYEYILRFIDEVMENVNTWTKGLILKPNAESWKIHSPNEVAEKQ